MNYLLFNEFADNGKGKEHAEGLLPSLSGSFPSLTLLSTKDLDIASFVDELKESDNLILFGGDGTINHFVNALGDKKAKCPFYLKSAGTGNDFALDVKDKEDPSTGLIRINEFIENLPYVEVKGKTYRFINGIGYGIDGDCCVKAEEMKKAGAKDIDYGKITIGLLFKGFTPKEAKVKVDGEEYAFSRVYIASAMNGRYYGGGMKVAPEQERSKGYLTFVTMFGKGKLGTLLMFPSLFKGTHLRYEKNTKAIKGKCIEVSFSTPTGLQIDGEVVEGVTSYKAYVK